MMENRGEDLPAVAIFITCEWWWLSRLAARNLVSSITRCQPWNCVAAKKASFNKLRQKRLCGPKNGFSVLEEADLCLRGVNITLSRP
jgi:hypothetical protein